VGYDADLTIFETRQQPQVFVDSDNVSVEGESCLVPLVAVVAGEAVLTDEGNANHVITL